MSIVRLSLLLTALPYASTESYVVYNPVTHTSAPPPRALGSAVLQHTVSNTAALGRYIWYFGGLNAALNPLNDLCGSTCRQTCGPRSRPAALSRSRGAAPRSSSPSSAMPTSLVARPARARSSTTSSCCASAAAGATPVWEDITTNATGVRPAARTEHTATIANLAMLPGSPHGMLLFGGKDGSGVALADLHAFLLDHDVDDARPDGRAATGAQGPRRLSSTRCSASSAARMRTCQSSTMTCASTT